MSVVWLAARLVMAVVFAVAGALKLADLGGSRLAVREFGVPQRLASSLGTLLPFCELAVAAALIGSGSARWGAVGALALLGGFVVAITVALVKGREPDCHCFGQVHSRPVGVSTLARILALAGVAALVVWHPTGSLSEVAVIGLAAAVVFGVQGWFCYQLLRQNGRILVRLMALEQPGPAQQASGSIGSPAPNFVLPAADDASYSLPSLLAHGRPLLLVFVSPGCGPCDALLPLVAIWQQRFTGQLTTAVISAGSLADNQALAAEHQLQRLLIQSDGGVAASYEVTATPSVVLIDEHGRLASQIATGQDAILELVAGVVGSGGDQDRHAASAEVPTVPSRLSANARVAATLGAATLVASVGPSGTAQAADADRQAISDLLARANPHIEAHARTLKAASKRLSSTLAAKPAVRSAELHAVERQRQDFIDLRQAVSKAAASTPQASYAKQLVIDALKLLEAAYRKIEDSLHTGSPAVASRSLSDSKALFDRALQRGVDAGAALRAP